MALIVVKENQTVRGVKMSHEQFIINHIKVIVLVFGLLFLGSSVFGQTTTVRTYVNGEESPFPIVSMTETPHVVKVTITNNETGEEEEISTEEEPDCE
jgi:hypothetical protein|tara:strand:- start:1733 stop:2026 length:294 start_codon:yes stop_codon:yes gene_type:complete